jgi:hypothetical protein
MSQLRATDALWLQGPDSLAQVRGHVSALGSGRALRAAATPQLVVPLADDHRFRDLGSSVVGGVGQLREQLGAGPRQVGAFRKRLEPPQERGVVEEVGVQRPPAGGGESVAPSAPLSPATWPPLPRWRARLVMPEGTSRS